MQDAGYLTLIGAQLLGYLALRQAMVKEKIDNPPLQNVQVLQSLAEQDPVFNRQLKAYITHVLNLRDVQFIKGDTSGLQGFPDSFFTNVDCRRDLMQEGRAAFFLQEFISGAKILFAVLLPIWDGQRLFRRNSCLISPVIQRKHRLQNECRGRGSKRCTAFSRPS